MLLHHVVQRRVGLLVFSCVVSNCMCLCFHRLMCRGGGYPASLVFRFWNCLKRFTPQVSHPFQGHPFLGCRPLPSLRAFFWGSESRGASRTFGRMLCVGWVHDCSVSAFCFRGFRAFSCYASHCVGFFFLHPRFLGGGVTG